MKKSWILVFVLLGVLSFAFAGCGDDEDEAAMGGEGQMCRGYDSYCDPACDFAAGEYCENNTCVEGTLCDPECDYAAGEYCDLASGTCKTADLEDAEVVEPCDDGLECNWDTGICEAAGAVETCDPECAEGEECVDGACVPIGSGTCDPACEEGFECVEGECVEVTEECLDEDCPGIQLCDEEGACSGEASLVCMDGLFNQACSGVYEFSTVAYGECSAVPCVEDADCAGLDACDDPEAGSTPEFMCDMEAAEAAEGEGLCKRTTTK